MVGRHAWLAAGLLYVLAVNLVLAAVTALGFVAMGLPAAGSVALAAGCGLNGLVFAGVAAVTVQLTEYARPANGIAFAVLGVAFLLRAIGDTASGLSWLSWLSPIGWAERFRPFAGERWGSWSCRSPCSWSWSRRPGRCSSGATSAPGCWPTRLGPGRRLALAAQPARPGLAAPARRPGRLDGRVGRRRPVVRR